MRRGATCPNLCSASGDAKREDVLRNFDFSSWQAILTTVIGIALFAFIGIGIRLLVMQTIQQRQQRMNRQINERLRTLIAAYKVLGGSFTGNLSVDPRHMRDAVRAPAAAAEAEAVEATAPAAVAPAEVEGDAPGGPSERGRQIRDAVEAALSDIILLGTEEHVRLAEHDGIDAMWFAGDLETSTMVEKASVGNVKQTWTTRGLYYDLADREKFEGTYLLQRATQIKNIWIPYGA